MTCRKKKGERLRIKRRSVRARVNRDDVFLLYKIYRRSDLSINGLAQQVWERYGYANAHSCERALSEAFRSYGLPSKLVLRKEVA